MLTWFGPAIAQADFLQEIEQNGMASNNTLAQSQPVPSSSFTPNADPNIFGSLPTASIAGRGGGMDVDFYSFYAPAASAYLDIDDPTGSSDTYLALFDASGTLIGENDDSFPADPGSGSDRDAFLGTMALPSPGTYYLAVATIPNFALASFTGNDFTELTRPDGAYGGFAFGDADFGVSDFAQSGPQLGANYSLHISIPEPGSLVLLAVASGVVLLRRRAT